MLFRSDTTQDEQAWNRFIAAIEQWKGEPLQLFIIPYGEALIHRYYRKGMMHLAALPQVAGISCQTNLSFPAKHWLDEIRVAPTVISKIRLWASFHPEMTSVEKFAHQIHILHHAGIQVCAGAVGIFFDLSFSFSFTTHLFISTGVISYTPSSTDFCIIYSILSAFGNP